MYFLYPVIVLYRVMKRVLRFGSSIQFAFGRHDVVPRLDPGNRNVSQLQAKPKSRHLAHPVMLSGILGMLGFNREEREEDPITSTVKSAILSIQVDRQDRLIYQNLTHILCVKEEGRFCQS